MKKFLINALGFVALVVVLILFFEMAFASQDEADRIEFMETVQSIEAKAQTYAVIQLGSAQATFRGLNTVQVVGLGLDLSESYAGQIGLGMVIGNRFSVALPDGNRFTVYITDGVDQIMETRFPVYVEE